MITVVVVDDHPVVRAGMRKVLDAAGDISVCAEGVSWVEGLRPVEREVTDQSLVRVAWK